jgi:hypothetical protein
MWGKYAYEDGGMVDGNMGNWDEAIYIFVETYCRLKIYQHQHTRYMYLDY